MVQVDADDTEFEADHDLINGVPPPDLDQLSSSLLSLSLVPRSRWQNLLHLDLIRQRNKPIEPPKKPEKAPFFLPSLQDRQTQPWAANQADPTTSAIDQPERIGRLIPQSASTYTTLLHTAALTSNYRPFISHLSALGPSAADIEIRTMSSQSITTSSTLTSGANESELVTFVHALTWLLHERRDFELGQAWMAVLLRVHGDAVVEDEVLRDAVEEWAEALDGEKKRVGALVGYCSGVVGWLRAARV